MNTETNAWNAMNDDEREIWIDEMLDRLSDLRAEIREAMAENGPDAEWGQYEQQDLYGEHVRSLLSEEALDAQDTDDVDEDVDERFRRHCAREFRRGIAPSSCAREWRCGGYR